jgi:hypothetical protein
LINDGWIRENEIASTRRFTASLIRWNSNGLNLMIAIFLKDLLRVFAGGESRA